MSHTDTFRHASGVKTERHPISKNLEQLNHIVSRAPLTFDVKRVYLGLGSNLANPFLQVSCAIAALQCLPQTQLISCSSFYRSHPMGYQDKTTPQDQADFLNAVVALDTQLNVELLLQHTQSIERSQGRQREKEKRWGARTLDIDILLYGDVTIHTEYLCIPHEGLKVREFVLYPLAEIAPDLIFPDKEHLSERLKITPPGSLTLW